MAVQIDSPGQLQDLFDVLKKRKWQVLLPIAYAVTLGVAFAVLVPKKYKCTTQVELREIYFEGVRNDKTKSISTIEAENAPQQLRSLTRIRQVVERLEWTDYLRLSRQEQNDFLVDLRNDLSIQVPRRENNVGSTFVEITYLDVNPQRAYQFLRELRTAWIEEVVERDRDQIQFEYKNLQETQADEERLFDRLQTELAQLRAANDLSPTQPSSGAQMTRNEDPQYVRLTQNQTKLADLAVQVKKADAAVAQLGAELEKTPQTVPRTEVVGGESYVDKVTQLREEVLELQRTLDDNGYRPAHSKYTAIQKKIEEDERMIEDLQGDTIESQERDSWVKNPAYDKIQEQLVAARVEAGTRNEEYEALKLSVQNDGEMNRKRQDVYRQERELQQKIEDCQTRRQELAVKLQDKGIQLAVISGPQGNPFTITQEPVPPAKPSQPNPILIIAFAIVLGIGLGIGSAILLEFTKSCFRTPADIGRVMAVPVLGVIGEIVTSSQRRRARIRRATVGVSSAVILCFVAFVTWAWATSPGLLTPGMRQGIEGFRELFR